MNTDDIDQSVAELAPMAQFVRIEGAIHSFFGDAAVVLSDEVLARLDEIFPGPGPGPAPEAYAW